MRVLSLILSLLLVGGCASPTVQPLPTTRPGGQTLKTVSALCYPPNGWSAEPLKKTGRHAHQVWVSPTGNTAYGVIHFSLPLPVGPDLVLRGFLREMARQEGSASLLDKQPDPGLPGLRFEAKGKLYHLWGNLMVRSWEGWAVYAGSLADKPVVSTELDQAVSAREATRVGAR